MQTETYGQDTAEWFRLWDLYISKYFVQLILIRKQKNVSINPFTGCYKTEYTACENR